MIDVTSDDHYNTCLDDKVRILFWGSCSSYATRNVPGKVCYALTDVFRVGQNHIDDNHKDQEGKIRENMS